MLLANPKIKIVSRIIEDKCGVPYLAYFAIAEFEGKMYVRLVRTAPINSDKSLKNEPRVALPCCGDIVSPYTPLAFIGPQRVFVKELIFAVSQPTRAPNFK